MDKSKLYRHQKGLLKQEDEKQIMKTLRDMKTFGQDIDIYGFEKFGQASMVDIRNLCIEYQKCTVISLNY